MLGRRGYHGVAWQSEPLCTIPLPSGILDAEALDAGFLDPSLR